MTRTDNQRIKSEAVRRAHELRRQAVNAAWDRLFASLRPHQPLQRVEA